MKLIFTFILSSFVPLSFAGQTMSEEQMMQQMQAAQECFSKVDQSKFSVLEAKGREMESELKALCAAGKRDEAMSKAMKYGKEFSASPELQEIRKCSELMQGVMANMQMPFMPPDVDEENNHGHICDDM